MSLHLPSEFDSYKPQVSFNIKSEQFTVKTAETKKELLGAFRLRNSVFYEEWTGKSSPTGLDIDKYDPPGGSSHCCAKRYTRSGRHLSVYLFSFWKHFLHRDIL